MVSTRDVENFIMYRSLDAAKLKGDRRARSHDFDCGPGDNVHFSSSTPHMTRSDTSWARPGNGVAVSIGINFYTHVTRRDAHIYAANQLPQRSGINPRPHHESESSVRLKYFAGKGVLAIWRLRGHQPPPRFLFDEKTFAD